MECPSQSVSSCPVCGAEAGLEAMLWEVRGRCGGCGHRPPFVVKRLGRCVVLTFLPELDYESQFRCLDDLLGTLQRGDGVVVNLTCLSLPSSFVLGMLIALRHRLRSRYGTLSLCCLSPQTQEVFEEAHLARLFNIYPDEPAAIAAI